MTNKKRLAIFAGYDKDNIIDDYVVYYIKELKKIADIIYVSDCDMLESELTKISEYCIHIINGRHGEYDFGSYKRGYLYAKENNILQNYNYLILCNDSCYGPFFNLSSILNTMEEKDLDAWSIFHYCKDKYVKEHLQSYFLSIRKNVFLSDWYNKFLLSVKKEENKKDIIENYEMGLTTLLRNKNLKIEGYLNSDIKDKEDDDNNLPFFNVTKMIKHGFPFFKITVFKGLIFFRLNINDLKTIFNLPENTYDINLIVKNLNRTIEDKEIIKYLFPRFKTRKIYIFSKNFIKINFKYSIFGKFQIIFYFFSKIKITINLPKSISYIDHKYKDFNFLLDEIKKKQ